MIEPELAKKYIERLTQYTEYNINIMNEEGLIIASRDPQRIGKYHAVADRIIHGQEEIVVIRDEKEFPGVLPGINMAIMHEGRKEGVIGVTGDPDAIRDVALITRLALDKKKTPVIIIDEANYVSNAILNDLKILFNFEMDSRDRAVILLVGLPQINNTLRLTNHEPLRQRIIMNYNLDGLSKEEGREYIAAKLKGAGCNQPVFAEDAVEAVLNAADGTARMISKLCNASLVIGHSRNANLISAEIVMQAINDSTII